MNRDIFCSCINLNQIHIQEKCGTSVGKEKAAVYSPHLNWHSTLAVVPSIFYCDTLHPRFYQIPESQSWSRLYCDSHIGVKSFMKSKLKIWYFITCTIRIVPGWWAWSPFYLPCKKLIFVRLQIFFACRLQFFVSWSIITPCKNSWVWLLVLTNLVKNSS